MSTKTLVTEEELLRLPKDGRKYDLVDGEIKVGPAGMEHEAIGAMLILLLGQHAKSKKLGRVYGSSVGQAGWRRGGFRLRLQRWRSF